jgi:hypothetical protein
MESCTQCHLDLVNAHKEIAHWLTSSKLTPNMAASFLKSNDNFFDIKDQTRVAFSFSNDTLYQAALKLP